MISVIIPLYNKEACISETVKSVLCQTYNDFELIIVNDGSKDKSLDIVKGISDSRIRIINKKNEGVSKTRNRGLDEATGEYVFLLDADDILRPNALLTLYNLSLQNPDNDIYVGSFVEKDDDNRIVKTCININNNCIENIYEAVWTSKFIPRAGNMMIRTEYVRKIGGMNVDMTLYEDLEWIYRLFANSTAACSSEIILEYIRSNNGLSSKKTPIKKEYAYYIRLRESHGYLKKLEADHLFRRIVKRILSKDFRGTKVLLKQNKGYWFYCLYNFLTRYF